MYKLTSQLIVYRDVNENSFLNKMSEICARFDRGDYHKETLVADILEQIHHLLDLATIYGFNHNLWHNYLAYLLATTETPFTLVSEKKGAVEGSVNLFVYNDLSIFKQLFDYDFSPLEETLGINCFSIIENFAAVVKNTRSYNKEVSYKVQALSKEIEQAETIDAFYQVITDFYASYGVGKLGLNKAFRLAENEDILIPITNTSDVVLDDLVGYTRQKETLIENTEAFVNGKKANNVLLYGDAGTGKSTSVKAILNQYYPKGLRMIEIYKHQFKDLSKVISYIKNRNYRFIIFMDDLSFEESETDYKYLKAIIEGGLEPTPDNVLIYATSNRRHLVRETFKDREADNDDIHHNDTVQEKLSLAHRFGISIGYYLPSPKEFMHIVSVLASRYPELQISEDELRFQANQWKMRNGTLSGRTAQQFIDYLVGTKID
ncbi:MAG: ATP-binding protein [bacterium]